MLWTILKLHTGSYGWSFGWHDFDYQTTRAAARNRVAELTKLYPGVKFRVSR